MEIATGIDRQAPGDYQVHAGVLFEKQEYPKYLRNLQIDKPRFERVNRAFPRWLSQGSVPDFRVAVLLIADQDLNLSH